MLPARTFFIGILLVGVLGILGAFLFYKGDAPLSGREEKYPEKKEGIKDPDIAARSFALYLVDPTGVLIFVAGKNIETDVPIASVTKLMTALVVEEKPRYGNFVSVSPEALQGKGGSGRFRGGEVYYLRDLVQAMLVESNNDAARALTKEYGETDLIQDMNKKAHELGLSHTKFVNSSGLDGPLRNVSTARDIAVLLTEVSAHSSDILTDLGLIEANICTVDNSYCYKATTTNALLLDSSFPMKIVGGKTGETPQAKKNLALLLKTPAKEWNAVAVILGSDDHFGEMKKLTRWFNDSYTWP